MFAVSYDIVTPDSAEHGDYEESAIIDVMPLRDAVETLFQTRTSLCDGIECVEASDSQERHARWVTVHNGSEYETGARESRSLFFPDHITPSSRARLVRLIKGRA